MHDQSSKRTTTRRLHSTAADSPVAGRNKYGRRYSNFRNNHYLRKFLGQSAGYLGLEA